MDNLLGHKPLPRARRYAAHVRVQVGGPTVASFTCYAWNISMSGMLINTPHTLLFGDVVTISSFGHHDKLCIVVRENGREAGLRFVEAISRSQARAWASGVLAEQYVEALGGSFAQAFPVERAPGFDDLLDALNHAEGKGQSDPPRKGSEAAPRRRSAAQA